MQEKKYIVMNNLIADVLSDALQLYQKNLTCWGQQTSLWFFIAGATQESFIH